MNWHFWSAAMFLGLLLLLIVYELGWDGGDPNDSGHNRPPWSMW